MQIKEKILKRFPVNEVRKFIVIFYLVGIAGISIPFTRNLFFMLTPLALLFNFLLLLIYQQEKLTLKQIIVFTVIFLSGFLIEYFGVKTGEIFGEYKYGNGLGIKLFDIPLIIGINWLLLVYLTYDILQFIKIEILRVIAASFLMVFYDFFVEHVAGFMDMWYWKNETIPYKNYLAWFVFSLIFVSLFSIFKIKLKNKLSLVVFITQTLFFAVIYALKSLFY